MRNLKDILKESILDDNVVSESILDDIDTQIKKGDKAIKDEIKTFLKEK